MPYGPKDGARKQDRRNTDRPELIRTNRITPERARNGRAICSEISSEALVGLSYEKCNRGKGNDKSRQSKADIGLTPAIGID